MNQRRGRVLVAVGLGLLALVGLLGALGAAEAGLHPSATGDVTEGLEVHYKFDEGGDPTVVEDSSGLDNDGERFGGVRTTTTPPLWEPNVYAIWFDGVDDYIEAPNIDLSNRSFSVAFWASRHITGTGHFVVSQGKTEENQGLQIGFRSSDLFTFAFWDNDLDTPTTYAGSDWHHWACTYNADTNERIIYFDGTAVAADTALDDYNYSGDGHLIIGNYFDLSYPFDGLIDEVRVYTRALGAPEVVELAGRAGTVADALMALYDSTTGVSWTVKTNWGTDLSYCEWYGITCSREGVSEIWLPLNNLSGTIPPELGMLGTLVELWLNDNNLTGTIPSALGTLGSLQYLNLSYNNLAGAIPSELGELNNLTFLHLGSNNLTGAIPSELAELSNLTSLWLYKNSFTGTIPSELGELSNLRYLALDDNSLTGTIPPELAQLGELSNLQHLYLNNNSLSGAIPPELGELSNLTSLWLNENNHTGAIPSELGELSNLTSLHLESNNLTGTIPSELGELSNLYYLHLYNNSLTGAIPPELGELSALYALDLHDNYLGGPIPWELANLGNLDSLYLHNNPRLICWETETALEWAVGLDYYDGPNIVCAFLYLPQVLR